MLHGSQRSATCSGISYRFLPDRFHSRRARSASLASRNAGREPNFTPTRSIQIARPASTVLPKVSDRPMNRFALYVFDYYGAPKGLRMRPPKCPPPSPQSSRKMATPTKKGGARAGAQFRATGKKERRQPIAQLAPSSSLTRRVGIYPRRRGLTRRRFSPDGRRWNNVYLERNAPIEISWI